MASHVDPELPVRAAAVWARRLVCGCGLAALAALAATVTGAGAAPSVYSTYFGGGGSERALGAFADASGNLYLTGSTDSADFPVTANAAQRTAGGGGDAFVVKFDANGSLVYATYLGGSGADEGRGIAVDSAGHVYVAGMTQSANFPTASARQPRSGGGRDAFLVELASSGAIVSATYEGGSGDDKGLALAVDGSGAVYMAGESSSGDFPTTAGAADPTANGSYDAFVTKVLADGRIGYSTLLGGPGFDDALAVAADSSGNAFVTGKASAGFPVTAGAFDRTPNGGYDMFVSKLNPSGSSLLYSTLLGGGSWDEGLGIDVDQGGSAYVTGNVQSPDFPTTTGAYQRQFRGSVDAAVTKLSPAGDALVYSTLLGGTGWTEGDGLAVDAAGNAFIAGHLDSTDYPTTTGAFQRSYGGNVDGFAAVFDPSGTKLSSATYLGGSGHDAAWTLAVGSDGTAYLAGATSSDNFPVTTGAYQPRLRGPSDAFATRLPPPAAPPTTSPDYQLSAAPSSATVSHGSATTYTVTVTRLNGWAYHVLLSVAGLPAGATAQFQPPGTQTTSTLTVATASTTPPGTYTLVISGTSNGIKRSTSVILTVR